MNLRKIIGTILIIPMILMISTVAIHMCYLMYTEERGASLTIIGVVIVFGMFTIGMRLRTED